MSTLIAHNPVLLDPSELRKLLAEYREENWKGIQTPEVRQRIVDDLMQSECESVFRRIAPWFDLPTGGKVLDVGSGVGSFVAACRERGVLAFGIEPDRIGQGGHLTAIQIASRRVMHSVFVAGVGESLPFPDMSFDLVVLNQVVEHVTHQPSVLREAARVLKPGGSMYLAFPNYLCFHEPHYKIFWLPLMPKWLGRAYLRLRGRSAVLLNQVQYTTNRRVKKLLAEIGNGFTLVDLHREEFLHKNASRSFASRRAKMLCALTRLPLVGRYFLRGLLALLSTSEAGCELLLVRRGDRTPSA